MFTRRHTLVAVRLFFHMTTGCRCCKLQTFETPAPVWDLLLTQPPSQLCVPENAVTSWRHFPMCITFTVKRPCASRRTTNGGGARPSSDGACDSGEFMKLSPSKCRCVAARLWSAKPYGYARFSAGLCLFHFVCLYHGSVKERLRRRCTDFLSGSSLLLWCVILQTTTWRLALHTATF